MPVTLSCEVTVATGDLRNALRAVVPHARQLVTDDFDALTRVRLVLDTEHVNVMASNGSTAALAIVSIEDDSRRQDLGGGILTDDDGRRRFVDGDGPLVVDLTPRQCRILLQQFKAKDTDPEGVDQLLSLRVLREGKGLEVTDTSGLFAGESVRFPGVGVSDNFPDVVAIIRRALAAVGEHPVLKPLTTDGAVLALFKPASTVYRQPLIVEPSGTPESRTFLVRCSDSFLGVVSSRHQDDDSLAKRDAAHRGWLVRLGLDRGLVTV